MHVRAKAAISFMEMGNHHDFSELFRYRTQLYQLAAYLTHTMQRQALTQLTALSGLFVTDKKALKSNSVSFTLPLAQDLSSLIKKYFNCHLAVKEEELSADQISSTVNFKILNQQNLINTGKCHPSAIENADHLTINYIKSLKHFISAFAPIHPEIVSKLLQEISFDLLSSSHLIDLQKTLLKFVPLLDTSEAATTIRLKMVQLRNNIAQYPSDRIDTPISVSRNYKNCNFFVTLTDIDSEVAFLIMCCLPDPKDRFIAAQHLLPHVFLSCNFFNKFTDFLISDKMSVERLGFLISRILIELNNLEKDKICSFLPFIDRLYANLHIENEEKKPGFIYVNAHDYFEIIGQLFLAFITIGDTRGQHLDRYFTHCLSSTLEKATNFETSAPDFAFIAKQAMPGLLKLRSASYVMNDLLANCPEHLPQAIKKIAKVDPLAALDWCLKKFTTMAAQEWIRAVTHTLWHPHVEISESLADELADCLVIALSAEPVQPIPFNLFQTEKDFERVRFRRDTFPTRLEALWCRLAPQMSINKAQTAISDHIKDLDWSVRAWHTFYKRKKERLNFKQDGEILRERFFFKRLLGGEDALKFYLIFDLEEAERRMLEAIKDFPSRFSCSFRLIIRNYRTFIETGRSAVHILESMQSAAEQMSNSDSNKVDLTKWLIGQENS